MKGYPKYEFGDMVRFKYGDTVKTGVIVIIDKYGTWEDGSDVSYDIMVKEDNCLYKHIKEDTITEKIGHATNEEMNKIW